MGVPTLFFFFFNFFFNVYLFLRQRETQHEGGRVRESGRHRIRSRLQALSHQPRARRGARTRGPRDRDLAEVGRLTDCATQAPLMLLLSRDLWCPSVAGCCPDLSHTNHAGWAGSASPPTLQPGDGTSEGLLSGCSGSATWACDLSRCKGSLLRTGCAWFNALLSLPRNS